MGYQESANAALYELKREGTSGEDVARVGNIAIRSFRALTDMTSNALDNAAALFVTLAKLGKPEPLELVARDAGFILVPVPKCGVLAERGIVEASGRAVRGAAELIEEFGAALSGDGEIDDEELARIEAATRKAQSSIAAILQLAKAKHDGIPEGPRTRRTRRRS